MGKLYMKFAMENPDYYDLMFIAKGIGEKISEKNDWEVGNRSYQYLRDTVKDCIEQGYLVKADSDAAAFAIWGLVHGMSSLIIRGRCALIPDEVVDNMVSGGLQFFYDSTAVKK
jgi:hypothetical protein